ncbi:MAG: RNA polymerase sigma factor [Candidatus Dormibacteria bacterium]
MEDQSSLSPGAMHFGAEEGAFHEDYCPGSEVDFEQLYRTEYQHVLFFVRSLIRDEHAAEDCTQETFVRAYKAWDRWRPDAPAAHWLLTIAYRVVISHIRSKRIRAMVGLGDDVEERVVASTSTPLYTTSVMEAIQNLPHAQRVCVVLRYAYGYTNREIGRILRTSESTVASRLSLARNRLQKELKWEEEK